MRTIICGVFFSFSTVSGAALPRHLLGRPLRPRLHLSTSACAGRKVLGNCLGCRTYLGAPVYQLHPPPYLTCSGLIERIFDNPTLLIEPWKSYENLTLLAIKTVPTVDCNVTIIPGCFSYGNSNVTLSFASKVSDARAGNPSQGYLANTTCAWHTLESVRTRLADQHTNYNYPLMGAMSRGYSWWLSAMPLHCD